MESENVALPNILLSGPSGPSIMHIRSNPIIPFHAPLQICPSLVHCDGSFYVTEGFRVVVDVLTEEGEGTRVTADVEHYRFEYSGVGFLRVY